MPMAKVIYRRAVESDLPAIVRLLADDVLGSAREMPEPGDYSSYVSAFRMIDADSSQFLLVVEEDAEIIATLQLSFIPGLAHAGLRRGQIEAVRVASHRRGEGTGEAMLRWAIAQCRRVGCGLVLLSTDRTRADAHRFYDRLGFEPSHVGYKMRL
jgi:GNAT superfamily N-acetyltransferase